MSTRRGGSFRAAMEKHILEAPERQEKLTKVLDEIILNQRRTTKVLKSLDKKQAAVMGIKINGTEPLPGEFPLMTSLRGIHDVIAPAQARSKFWQSFYDYRQVNWFFSMLRIPIVRYFLIGVAGITANSVLLKNTGHTLSWSDIVKLIGLGG